jgi:hypothetical protein
MGYFLDNWGSFASLVGVIISAAGLAAALVAMQRAGKARDSAEAAELASRETRDAITGVLVMVELQRAIALIQRIKDLIQDDLWVLTLGHYQPLRAMLADIRGRFQSAHPIDLQVLQDAINQVTVIDDVVAKILKDGLDPSVETDVREILNELQAQLERMASATYLDGIRMGEQYGNDVGNTR